MKQKTMLTLLLSVIFTTIYAQTQLPLIHTNTDQIDIRDGDYFEENAWGLAPDARPDIYTSSSKGETVTFYTDLDSISYIIHPDSVYDFVILLNNKDSAFTQIKYVPSKLDILKGAAAYNEEEVIDIPEFTYQDSSAVELKTLRAALNLDSIAGTCNEFCRIINLMNWVHDLIPHDGNHENPIVKNAISMIDECKRDERGLNCRGLATVLNECYLSLGIKSRIITCMPKDSVFMDCHAFNMVYSNDLEKWLWIDPTNDAYIMDETGTMLGLGEVRERLINDKTLIINPDANWNNRFSKEKSEYLDYYMAKNLYRFSCAVRSEYNYETWEDGKVLEYVELIPLDGFNQSPKFLEKTNKQGVTEKVHKTNNPNLFWTKPE